MSKFKILVDELSSILTEFEVGDIDTKHRMFIVKGELEWSVKSGNGNRFELSKNGHFYRRCICKTPQELADIINESDDEEAVWVAVITPPVL